MALVGFMLLLAASAGPRVGEASPRAQTGGWSDPMILTTEASRPILAADSAGDLHLFFVGAEGADDPQAKATIFYMNRIGRQWSPPLDVLISPGSSVSINGAVVDATGYIHVAWHDSGAAYHSKAHVSMAGNASNWQTEVVITGRIPTGDMVLDDNGRLHRVVVVDFASVVYLYSDDGGNHWSAPVTVERLLDVEEFSIGGTQMAVDQTGGLHVTWTMTAQEVDWNLWSVWYGRSSDGGSSWQLTEMAAPLFGDSDIAVDGDNNVHLVYGRNIGYADGRWYQWSSNGGETWSNARLLYQGVAYASGITGGFDFALDSAGQLHMVNSYGGRQGGLASAWHMVWLGTRWSEPELLLGTEFHPHFCQLEIIGGNKLEFVSLAPAESASLVYREGTAASPATEIQPVPTRMVEIEAEEATIDEADLVEATPAAPTIVLSDEARAAPPTDAPFNTLLISVGLAAIVVLLVVVYQRRNRDGRR